MLDHQLSRADDLWVISQIAELGSYAYAYPDRLKRAHSSTSYEEVLQILSFAYEQNVLN